MLTFVGDFRRILSLTENLLFLAGRSLQRRALRNGLIFGLAYLSTITGFDYSEGQILSTQELLGLLVTSFASYPAGALLVRVSNLLIQDNLRAAAAGHLHLSSHFKQSRMRYHLQDLWRQVFRYESVLNHTPGERAINKQQLRSAEDALAEHLSKLPSELLPLLSHDDQSNLLDMINKLLSSAPHSPDIEASEEAFMYTGLYALNSPLPMTVQHAQIGFNLSPLEDWYEKGLFSYEDFLAKSMGRDPVIITLQKHFRHPLQNLIWRWFASEPVPSFWYSLSARKYGALIGKGVRALNKRAALYGFDDFFNAQHFIWPSREMEFEVIEKFAEDGKSILKDLLIYRRDYMRSLFSGDLGTAKRHIFKICKRDFVAIFRLRINFDIEFSLGLIEQTPEKELSFMKREFGCEAISEKKLNKWLSGIKSDEGSFADFIDRNDFRLDPEEIRALRICWFSNLYNVRDLSDNGRIISVVKQRTIQISEWLQRVRVYYVLSKLYLDTYLHVVKEIGKLR